jgi:hypothetical protein
MCTLYAHCLFKNKNAKEGYHLGMYSSQGYYVKHYQFIDDLHLFCTKNVTAGGSLKEGGATNKNNRRMPRFFAVVFNGSKPVRHPRHWQHRQTSTFTQREERL